MADEKVIFLQEESSTIVLDISFSSSSSSPFALITCLPVFSTWTITVFGEIHRGDRYNLCFSHKLTLLKRSFWSISSIYFQNAFTVLFESYFRFFCCGIFHWLSHSNYYESFVMSKPKWKVQSESLLEDIRGKDLFICCPKRKIFKRNFFDFSLKIIHFSIFSFYFLFFDKMMTIFGFHLKFSSFIGRSQMELGVRPLWRLHCLELVVLLCTVSLFFRLTHTASIQESCRLIGLKNRKIIF